MQEHSLQVLAFIPKLNYFNNVIVPVGIPMSLHYNPLTNRIVWNKVNCSLLNGRFVGYNLLLHSNTYNLNSTIILNDLVFGIVYSISVAAVNSVGRGPFSDPITVEGIYE